MKILSPYTKTEKKPNKLYIILGSVMLLILVMVIGYISFDSYNDDKVINSEISYKLGE